jgi:hypothetical protein
MARLPYLQQEQVPADLRAGRQADGAQLLPFAHPEVQGARGPQCERETPPDAFFCPERGAKIVSCAQCQSANAATHKFCTRCGRPLPTTPEGDTGSQANRRKAQRSLLVLPVKLENGTGRTRDMSASGVFMEMDEPVELGSAARFSLVLAHLSSGEPLRLQCAGRVVRLERRDGKWGAAVAVTEWA